MDKVRVCKDCGLSPQQTEFGTHPATWDRLSIVCKSCNRKRTKRSEAAYSINKKARRKAQFQSSQYKNTVLLRKYQISFEEYTNLLEKQHNSCAICFNEFDSSNLAQVDHDHSLGIVRGMLCRNCNWGLGHFKDRIELLSNAMKYLLRNVQPDVELNSLLYEEGEKRLDVRSMRHLRISSEGRERLFSYQGNCCLICKENFSTKRFHIDHSHQHGQVRGILCNNCNVGLGNFQDSRKLLAQAIIYLR